MFCTAQNSGYCCALERTGCPALKRLAWSLYCSAPLSLVYVGYHVPLTALYRGDWGPHLIVVPTSVMLNWEMEFKKWCPAFKLLTYFGSAKERKLKRHGWSKPNAFHICITSYTLVLQVQDFMRIAGTKAFNLDVGVGMACSQCVTGHAIPEQVACSPPGIPLGLCTVTAPLCSTKWAAAS